jgi:CHAT domain-containing protein
MGGWAQVLLARGAGAVVAPLWSVGDGAALRFAEGFYTALLAGSGFAEASSKARQHARRHGDPSWLAYAVYAQAGGTVEVVEDRKR